MPALRRARRSITEAAPGHPRAAHPLRATALGLALAASALVAAAPATSKAPPPLFASPLLWATVNVCDTPDRPDTIGIRGSMPGSGVRTERMHMRFQVQFLDPADDKWHTIGASGDSGFVPVGSAIYKARQTGRSFVVPAPRSGAFKLRGAVTFEWRRKGEVVRRVRRSTTAGHPAADADPRGFSARTCDVAR